MCNVTNLPFRILCKRYGASVVYSEMINADAFIRQKTKKRVYFLEQERPIAIQVFGSEEHVLVMALRKIEAEIKPDIIDLNIGCPAYSVMKLGAGANLLYDIDRLSRLVSSLSNAISIPLTCKMRITHNDEQTINIAKSIEVAGARAITVHGRTPKQKYSGKANWDIIKKIKEIVTIPVILNGDVKDELSAEKAFEYTKCDAVMIGRAAIGNPYLFKRINQYLATGKFLERQTLTDRIKDFKEYIVMCQRYDYTDLLPIKMQAQNFTKVFIGSKTIRDKISRCDSVAQILKILDF